MVVAAVGCALPSASLNLQTASRIASSRKVSGSLAWDPLHQCVLLRSSSHFSSPTSFVQLGRKAPRSRVPGIVFLRAKVDKKTNNLPDVDAKSKDRNGVDFLESVKTLLGDLLNATAKPAVIAAMVALLLTEPSDNALAASSGGRVGGKVFSKPSAPSRSYSGGGGGRSYSGGMYAAPPIFSSPYGFSPYYGGYGGGLYLGGPSIFFGGGGTIFLAMIAFATLRAFLGFIRDRFSGDDDDQFDD